MKPSTARIVRPFRCITCPPHSARVQCAMGRWQQAHLVQITLCCNFAYEPCAVLSRALPRHAGNPSPVTRTAGAPWTVQLRCMHNCVAPVARGCRLCTAWLQIKMDLDVEQRHFELLLHAARPVPSGGAASRQAIAGQGYAARVVMLYVPCHVCIAIAQGTRSLSA